MKKKFFLLLVLSAFFICDRLYAQDPYVDGNQLPSASRPASGAGSDIVNIDLYTGVPYVTIPIYNCSVDGLNMGVALSYNAKGIPVDQTASSIGLGWDVSAGGYIVRDVKGIEDEANFQTVVPITYGGLTIMTFSHYLGALMDTSIGGQFETEHDVFTAVFGGRSVQFALDGKGGISTSPHCQINIQMFVDGVYYNHNLPSNVDKAQSSGILTFTITDEQGDVFTFGRGDYEKKISTIDGSTYYPIDKWVLTNVTTIKGKTVTFSYNSYPTSYKQYLLDTVIEDNVGGVFSPDGTPPPFPGVSIGNSGTSQAIYWTGDVSQISSIQYPDGTYVSFNLTDLVTRCDLASVPICTSITIKNGYSPAVTNSITYSFVQSYLSSIQSTSSPGFTITSSSSAVTTPLVAMSGSPCSYINSLVTADGISSTQATDELNMGLRLILNKIVKIGTDGVTTEPYYTFSYNSTLLPPRLSVSQDWYGYFNNYAPSGIGADGLPLAVPLHDGNGGVDKTPNASNLQAGILTKIVNGNGGEIDLNYQAPPSLSDPVSSYPSDMDEGMSTYDGLCINNITYQDGYNVDNTYTTTYSFSNGYRFYPGSYFWYPTSYLSGSVATRKLTNHMVTPMDYFHGCNHGYGNVTVSKTGYSSEPLSGIQYTFSNILNSSGVSYLIDTQTQASCHTMNRTSMDQPQMGLLKSVADYGDGTLTMPISQTLYTYTTDTFPPLQNTSNFIFPNLIQAYESSVLSAVTASRIYNVFNSEAVNISSKTQNIHEGTAASSMVTNYTYDSKNNLSTESYLDSRGRLMIHQYFHNYDYNFTGYSPTAPTDIANYNTVNSMNSNNLQFVLADELRQNSNWPSYTTTPTPDSIIRFSQWLPNYGSGVITTNSMANSTILSPVPTVLFHHNSGAFFADNTFYNYTSYVNNFNQVTRSDDHYNILEAWTDNQQKVSSAIWDNRIGKKVVSVSNAQYSEIACTSFEGSFASWGTRDYNKGNWDFVSSNIVLGTSTSPAMTGSFFLQLVSGTTVQSGIIPTSGKKFLLSFWCNGTVPTVMFGSASLTMQSQITVGSWTLYTCYFTGTGSSYIVLSTSATTGIDELRLAPADAVVNTVTYEPFIGVSSQCDERNNITYYQYDPMGRLNVTRDINGNIISLTNTVIQGLD